MMELSDRDLVVNCDWDPVYLSEIFEEDFYDLNNLWHSHVSDLELVMESQKVERYVPIVEDISLDDHELCVAVEKIENELVCSESVQYFQFDKDGNMFVFAPGAGCTGESRLVRPGDDIFVDESQYLTCKSNVSTFTLKEESGQCSGFDGASSSGCSYHEPLVTEAFDSLTKTKFSYETMKKVRWVLKMYRDWRDYRNNSPNLVNVECDLDDQSTIRKDTFVSAVCKFLTEVKKLDGSDFPGKTLYDLVICIQFHLETLGYSWKLLGDQDLKNIRFTLDNMMKLHTSQGVGTRVCKAELLSGFDENYLWEHGILGTTNPEVLLNTVIFMIGKGFALRAGNEHRVLRSPPFNSQFEFVHDNSGVTMIRYKEDIGLKTNKGGLKHRQVDPKIVDMYPLEGSDRCPVKIIMQYLSLLPPNCKTSAFYLQPRKKFRPGMWYLDSAVGANKLRTVVKELCKTGGISGYFTNHSLKSTSATTMYQSDIDEQLIQEFTGHHSLAVCSYKRTCDAQCKMASNAIFGSQKTLKSE